MRPSGYTLGDSSGELESLRGSMISPRERVSVSNCKESSAFPSSSTDFSNYINELDQAVRTGSYKGKDIMMNKGGERGIEKQIGLDCGRSRLEQGQNTEGPESDLTLEASCKTNSSFRPLQCFFSHFFISYFLGFFYLLKFLLYFFPSTLLIFLSLHLFFSFS